MKVTAGNLQEVRWAAVLLLALIAPGCAPGAPAAPTSKAVPPSPATATRATSDASAASAASETSAAPGMSAASETSAAPETSDAAPAPKPDFPTLKVATFDGGQYDLAAHRGRWVVVNFWATWCNPCLKEIPGLAALDKDRDDLEVIGLAYEEIEHADMVAFLKTHPIPYPIAILDVYKPPADFETPRGLPMTYLIAPDGKVARTFLGPVEAADIRAVVDGAKAKA